jgi:signal transduction histidine kinase
MVLHRLRGRCGNGLVECLAAGPPLPCLEEACRESRGPAGFVRQSLASIPGYAIWNLRSPLEGTDLVGALRHTADEITAGSTIPCSCRVVGNRFRCAPLVEDHILRIGREAIRNAIRHAEATHVGVELCYDGPSVILRVIDDGRGFDADDLGRKHEVHYGLEGLQEHAALVGGRFRLITRSGGGTEIEVVIPAAQ